MEKKPMDHSPVRSPVEARSDDDWRKFNHRVKNNLQILSGLLAMSQERARHLDAKTALGAAAARLNVLIQYHQRVGSDPIFLPEFIKGVVGYIEEHSDGGRSCICRIRVAPVHLEESQTIPLGLVVNELVGNAFRHALVSGRIGRIALEAEVREASLLEVSVSDDGPGFPPGIDPETSDSLGCLLVRNLVRQQLGGRLRWSGGDGVAAVFQFEMRRR